MNRRRFGKMVGLGAAGSMLGPFLDQLVTEAEGQTGDRKRLVLFTSGNGFVERNYTCEARSETDFDLSPTLMPFAPYKDDLLVLSKFFNPHDKALHGNQWATLSVLPGGTGSQLRDLPPGGGGVSIDRHLAHTVGAGDRFSSTAVGIAEGGNNILCVSVDGPGTPFPAIGSPVQAYGTWFGESTGVSEMELRRRLAREQSLLDGVLGDVNATRSRLAPYEQERLDQYLDSLRVLEGQLAGAEVLACEPVPPDDGLDRNNLDPRVVRAHVDTTFAAQQCGLTRVSHISILGREGPHNRYGWLGDMRGHHNNYHENDWDMILNIDHFILGEIAHYWGRLKETPEGTGTMADNTIVVYVNTCGGKHHNGQNLHAVLALGHMDGYFRTGRYLSFDEGQHAISDVYVSLANAMGLPIDTFGDAEICQGPLPGLTA
ncbi:MAG: DUF1552 domain-containing protein [Myxococcota bacterium]